MSSGETPLHAAAAWPKLLRTIHAPRSSRRRRFASWSAATRKRRSTTWRGGSAPPRAASTTTSPPRPTCSPRSSAPAWIWTMRRSGRLAARQGLPSSDCALMAAAHCKQMILSRPFQRVVWQGVQLLLRGATTPELRAELERLNDYRNAYERIFREVVAGAQADGDLACRKSQPLRRPDVRDAELADLLVHAAARRDRSRYRQTCLADRDLRHAWPGRERGSFANDRHESRHHRAAETAARKGCAHGARRDRAARRGISWRGRPRRRPLGLHAAPDARYWTASRPRRANAACGISGSPAPSPATA